MTATLMCDFCMAVSSSRAKDGERGASEWFELKRDPAMVAPDELAIGHRLGELGSALVEHGSEVELQQWEYEPPWHFCSESCLAMWLDQRRRGGDESADR